MNDVNRITHIDNVSLREDGKAVVIIDQSLLPNKTEYLELETPEQMYDAILHLRVRGAPAIGICAAYCMAVLAQKEAEPKPIRGCCGTGVADEDIYPYENSKVFERILENGGSIISEYIIGTKPLKYNFPARNRIISGLSDKIIVVEAKEKSGSLITVNYALEQGKDIFAVPGNIFSQNHEGINNLLKEGAYIMTCIDDLFLL